MECVLNGARDPRPDEAPGRLSGATSARPASSTRPVPRAPARGLTAATLAQIFSLSTGLFFVLQPPVA